MEFALLFKGIGIGLSIAAPVGPIEILCIHRNLAKGHLSGLASGMGAASADGFYGSVAAFGLTYISSFLSEKQIWLQIVGMMFLFYLGIKTYFETPKQNSNEEIISQSLIGDYLSTFALTIVNPMTIFSFAAIFAALGLTHSPENYFAASLVTIGVFSGSALWWIILSNGIGMFRKKISPNTILWVNKISGSIIILFALSILVTSVIQ